MFGDTKQKYVRVGEYDTILIFGSILNHSEFSNMDVKSAGFCYVNDGKVECFGKSTTLEMESHKHDSFFATRQLFGYDKAAQFENPYKDGN